MQFVMNETKFQAPGDTNNILDVLDFLGSMIGTLNDSVNLVDMGMALKLNKRSIAVSPHASGHCLDT